jgi:hypothetical protein
MKRLASCRTPILPRWTTTTMRYPLPVIATERCSPPTTSPTLSGNTDSHLDEIEHSQCPPMPRKSRGHIVGLHLAPPQNAFALYVDDTVPDSGAGVDRAELPVLQPGLPGTPNTRLCSPRHHYPFVALNVTTGSVARFLRFSTDIPAEATTIRHGAGAPGRPEQLNPTTSHDERFSVIVVEKLGERSSTELISAITRLAGASLTSAAAPRRTTSPAHSQVGKGSLLNTAHAA